MQFSYLLTTVLAGLAVAAPLYNNVEPIAPTKAIEKRFFPILLGLLTVGGVAGGTAAAAIKQKEGADKLVQEQKQREQDEAAKQRADMYASMGVASGPSRRAVHARETAAREESTAKDISLPQIHELFAEIEEMVTAQLSAEVKAA